MTFLSASKAMGYGPLGWGLIPSMDNEVDLSPSDCGKLKKHGTFIRHC